MGAFLLIIGGLLYVFMVFVIFCNLDSLEYERPKYVTPPRLTGEDLERELDKLAASILNGLDKK